MHMHVICVGLSHRTASIELRERLGFSASACAARLAHFAQAAAEQPAGLSELAILATCNRLEYYAASEEGPLSAAVEAVRQRLLAAGGAAPDLEAHLYQYTDLEAARHLARVAAGLDSRVLGETEILGQVSAAYQAALQHGTAGAALSALFPAAIRAGKRARTETAISRHATSLSTVAVQAASRAVPDLAAARVLVIGAGEMAALAVKALQRHRPRQVTITNRTADRAQSLADHWQAEALPFEQMESALAEADLVISATAAPHSVLTTAQVQAAMQGRPERPMVLIDLAVPRDIEPGVGQLAYVQCLNLDELDVDRHNRLETRRQAVPQVEAIVEAEAQQFGQWLEGAAIREVITGLRAKAEAIRRAEVERTLRHLPDLSAAERQHVEALAEALLNRLLHEPTTRLKSQAGGQAAAYSATVRDLFGLDGPT